LPGLSKNRRKEVDVEFVYMKVIFAKIFILILKLSTRNNIVMEQITSNRNNDNKIDLIN
jgi:hypothetical protein